MKEWLKIAEGKHKKYIVSESKVKQVENILKLLNMPKGLKAGESLYNCSTGYQWFIYIAIFCTVYRNDTKRRKYETCLLEIRGKKMKVSDWKAEIHKVDCRKCENCGRCGW